MKITYNNFEPLKENEIAGAQTINPMQRYMLGIHSLSEFLDVNPDGQGSISFDLNFEALAGSIIGMLGDNGGINFDFKCSVSSNNVLTVSGGKVFLPFDVCTVSSTSTSLSSGDSGKMVYVRLTSKTTGSIVLSSSVTHTIQTGNQEYRVTLPVATITYNNGWKVQYHHIGAFSLTQTPYCYIDGYSKGSAQSLDHQANTDDQKWNTYGECENNE